MRFILIAACCVGIALLVLPSPADACWVCRAEGENSECTGAVAYGAEGCSNEPVEWGGICVLNGGVIECGSTLLGMDGQVVIDTAAELSIGADGVVRRVCDGAMVFAPEAVSEQLARIVI